MDGLPIRPEFHLTANKGWINDPYGLTFRDGKYHLFFQYVPESTVWAPNCDWGHATSHDLVSWTEQPVAITPGDDDDGIWSGSIAIDGDNATIFCQEPKRTTYTRLPYRSNGCARRPPSRAGVRSGCCDVRVASRSCAACASLGLAAALTKDAR